MGDRGRPPSVAPRDEIPLGRLPDRQIAERLGLLPNTVTVARLARGIPAYIGPRERQCPSWWPCDTRPWCGGRLT